MTLITLQSTSCNILLHFTLSAFNLQTSTNKHTQRG
ncbi:hypothetical protein VP168E361_P0059 [Vibrio phage 168E36-1]|nr:hypothetical protein VP168E361_P0059 [Vibrio phage 168E36-1]